MKNIIRKILKNKNIIVFVGYNIGNVLNFLFAIIILKLGKPELFNIYSAFSSLYLILTTPHMIGNRIFTMYGDGLIQYLKTNIPSKFYRKSNSILLFIIGTLLLTVILILLFKIPFIDTLFLSISICIALIFNVFIAVLQSRERFHKTSIILASGFGIKFVLGLLLALFFQNIGIWFTVVIVAIYTLIFSYTEYKKLKGNIKKEEKINISFTDISTNILIFILLETIMNIDAVFVLSKFSTQDAYVYNSLSIIRKSIILAVTTTSVLMLAESRKNITADFKLLIKNIIINGVLGITVLVFAFIFKDLIYFFFNIKNIPESYYYAFIISAVLFVEFFIIVLWFGSLRSFKIRFLSIIGMLSYLIFYVINFTSFQNAVNLFIWGTLGIILYHIVLTIIIRFKLILFRLIYK